MAVCGEIPYAHVSLCIEALDGFFADFGTPEEILWDNRKQFDCVEFNRFCASRQVRHLTSSPQFPQSNNLAERHIQTVQMSMLKMFQDGKTLWEVLAAICSLQCRISYRLCLAVIFVVLFRSCHLLLLHG